MQGRVPRQATNPGGGCDWQADVPAKGIITRKGLAGCDAFKYVLPGREVRLTNVDARALHEHKIWVKCEL